MPFLERFFRRRQVSEQTGIPPAETGTKPNPELINLETHPLRLELGFVEYANSWNLYISDQTRLSLVERSRVAILRADEVAALAPEDTAQSTQDLAIASANARKQKEMIKDSHITGRKKQKILQRVNRDVRLKMDEVKEINRKMKITSDAKQEIKNSQDDLRKSDENFAMNLGSNGVVFYALERLRENRGRMDRLFYRYFKNITSDDSELRVNLTSANLDFLGKLHFYSGVPRPEAEKLWEESHRATERQIDVSS